MLIRSFISRFAVFVAVCSQALLAQGTAKLTLDATKPIVYIEFDHAGPRQPVEDGEPDQGLWLRLVNNSTVPIDVRANGTTTDSKMTLLPDVITPRAGRIPRSGPPLEKMPQGYSSDTATILTIDPGKSLVFSVPVNHVAPTWFMQVPFQFSLPPVKEGVQPSCYAEFTWEDLPKSYRVLGTKHSTGVKRKFEGTLLHESGHVNESPTH
jgi:hypothetical protein